MHAADTPKVFARKQPPLKFLAGDLPSLKLRHGRHGCLYRLLQFTSESKLNLNQMAISD